ncbi:MAG: DciA family protein [Mycobacteriales bacterium]
MSDDASAADDGDGVPRAPATGPDLARAILADVKAEAERRRAASPAARRMASDKRAEQRRSRKRRPGDSADPVGFGAAIEALLAARGWQADVQAASVISRWEHLVGADVAAHATPVSLNDRELVVQAESTAWATQLRLLSRSLLTRIQAEVGAETVASLRIHGPSGPSRPAGQWRTADSRGPRDTYG